MEILQPIVLSSSVAHGSVTFERKDPWGDGSRFKRWQFKIQGMTVQNPRDDDFNMDLWTIPTPDRLSGNHLLRMTRVILLLDIISNRSVASASVHFPYKYHTPPFSFLYFLLKTYCQSASVVLVRDHSVQLLYPSSMPFLRSLTILVSNLFFTSLSFFHIYFLFSWTLYPCHPF